MKLLSGFLSLSILSATIVSSIPVTRRDVDESLVPQFGFSAGVNPTGTGDCDGAVNGADGQPVKIPCSCPPDRAAFIQSLNANVAAGHVLNNPSVSISFPEDTSTASQLARIKAAIVTLQNINGTGQGCPVASTTFQAQAAAINNPVSTSLPPTPTTSTAHVPFVSPALGILMARQLLTSIPSPVGAILMARQLSSSPSPTPTISTINVPKVTLNGFILKARDSESTLPPAPTFSFNHGVIDILKARDSESTSSTASPSPTREIILVGPPRIDPLV